MLKLHALARAATAAALASLPAAAWSAPATETSDAPVRLEGTYRHAGPPGRVQRVIDRAIERVVAQSPALFRPVVRQRLAAKNPPIQAVALALGPLIVVRFNDEITYSTLRFERTER